MVISLYTSISDCFLLTNLWSDLKLKILWILKLIFKMNCFFAPEGHIISLLSDIAKMQYIWVISTNLFSRMIFKCHKLIGWLLKTNSPVEQCL